MSELRSSLQVSKQSHSYRFKINSGESGGPSFLDSVWDPQLSEAEFLAENYREGNADGFPPPAHCRIQTEAAFPATLEGSAEAMF